MKKRRPRSVAERRALVNGRGDAPSGAEYSLEGFGAGKVTNRGIKPDGYVPRGHRPSAGKGVA